MPLPERYEKEVPEIVDLWTGAGYFKAQGEVWLSDCTARSRKEGFPNPSELDLLRAAMVLSAEDVDYLNQPEGHETNRYIRLIQPRLPARLGNLIHLRKTSSDLLDTALSLQIRRSLMVVLGDFRSLSGALLKRANEHALTPQVGRTHGQHAIVQTAGRQFLGWYAEVKRGEGRIEDSYKLMGVGKASGEVGTNVYMDEELEDVALEQLGLTADEAPTQVISRDRHAQMAMNVAVNAQTLARIAGNIRTLSRTEIGEVREPFDPKAQQGSSSMPHKQNSELDERVSGLAKWNKNAAMAVLDSMVLSDERDISHSSTERFAYQDLFGTLSYAARILTKVITNARIYPDRMAANLGLTKGAIYSQRLLNEWIDAEPDRPRTDIYNHVRDLVLQGMEEDRQLLELALQDPTLQEVFNPSQLAEFFRPEFYLRNVGTAWRRLGLDDPTQ